MISIWTLLGIQLDPNTLTGVIGTQQYQNVVATRVAASPFANAHAWVRTSFHHPWQAVMLLAALRDQLHATIHLVVCKAISGGPGNTDYELELYPSPYANNTTQYIWIYADNNAHGSNIITYAGLAVPGAAANRPVLNLTIATIPFHSDWFAPKHGDEPGRNQNFPDVREYRDLLVDLRVWPGCNNALVNPSAIVEPGNRRYLTMTQLCDEVLGIPASDHRTMIYHRMEAAVKFYFGHPVWQRFRQEWITQTKVNQNVVTLNQQWEPARALEGILRLP